MAQESKSKKGKQPAAKGLLRDGPNWPLFILAALGMALSGYLTFTAWQGRLVAFCAEGTGCICVAVETQGFSRRGQKLTRAEPRPGEQRSGAPAPQGELSGERDSLGTEEALDQGG